MRLRLEYAERLLAETEDAIRDVAKQTGFSSSVCFLIAFKERYGVAPQIYRYTLGTPSPMT